MAEPSDGKQSGKGIDAATEISGWNWREIVTHFGVVAIILPLFIACLRILALSQGDPVVIPAIVASLDTKTIVFGAIIPFISIMALPMVIFLGVYLIITQTETGKWVGWTCTLATIPLILFSPVGAVINALLAAGAAVTRGRIRRSMDKDVRQLQDKNTSTLRELEEYKHKAALSGRLVRPQEYYKLKAKLQLQGKRFDHTVSRMEHTVRMLRTNSAVNIVFLIVMFVAWLMFTGPWLPTEEITNDNGDMRIAIVLSEENESLVVLYYKTREVERIPIDSVTSRKICDAEHAERTFYTGTLLGLFTTGRSTPAC